MALAPRSPLHKREGTLRHRYHDLSRDISSTVWILELEDQHRGDFLSSGNKQKPRARSTFLLENNPRRKILNPVLPYLGILGIGIEHHQRLKELRTKLSVLHGQKMGRLGP